MKTKFLLCISDGGYPEALEPRKFYAVLEDVAANVEGMVRIVDESGEDYLYPMTCFVEVPLSGAIEGRLQAA
ncbi:MAG TPA: hypothetical protein VIE67_06605 [Rudaea sp.]|jgi:hypothetical protein|uniref:hypothetical protein n=1 Tax=Rudaea sp. TaxID=2136325 RepID=UPI002F959DCD